MTKFTQGQHTVNEYDDGFWICSARGDNLAYIEKGEDVSLPQDAANATLFAAAPELYDALDRIMHYARMGAAASDVMPVDQPEFINAESALKKARGEE